MTEMDASKFTVRVMEDLMTTPKNTEQPKPTPPVRKHRKKCNAGTTTISNEVSGKLTKQNNSGSSSKHEKNSVNYVNKNSNFSKHKIRKTPSPKDDDNKKTKSNSKVTNALDESKKPVTAARIIQDTGKPHTMHPSQQLSQIVSSKSVNKKQQKVKSTTSKSQQMPPYASHKKHRNDEDNDEDYRDPNHKKINKVLLRMQGLKAPFKAPPGADVRKPNIEGPTSKPDSFYRQQWKMDTLPNVSRIIYTLFV